MTTDLPGRADALRAAHEAHRATEHLGQLGRGCPTCARYVRAMPLARIADHDRAERIAEQQRRLAAADLTGTPVTFTPPAS